MTTETIITAIATAVLLFAVWNLNRIIKEEKKEKQH